MTDAGKYSISGICPLLRARCSCGVGVEHNTLCPSLARHRDEEERRLGLPRHIAAVLAIARKHARESQDWRDVVFLLEEHDLSE